MINFGGKKSSEGANFSKLTNCNKTLIWKRRNFWNKFPRLIYFNLQTIKRKIWGKSKIFVCKTQKVVKRCKKIWVWRKSIKRKMILRHVGVHLHIETMHVNWSVRVIQLRSEGVKKHKFFLQIALQNYVTFNRKLS